MKNSNNFLEIIEDNYKELTDKDFSYLTVLLTPVDLLKSNERYRRAKLYQIENEEIHLDIMHELFNEKDSLALEVYYDEIFIGHIRKRFNDKDIDNTAIVNNFCFDNSGKLEDIQIIWNGDSFTLKKKLLERARNNKRIQEIADEVGLSTTELIQKSQELELNIEMIDQQYIDILIDYAISGTLPQWFKEVHFQQNLDNSKKANISQDIAASKYLSDNNENFVFIPAGSFKMGIDAPNINIDERVSCMTKIENDFMLSKFLVTFDEYDLFCEETGREKIDDRYMGRGKNPALVYYWDDAIRYCQWRSQQEGKIYRLPTEAEWEYACRAGTNTKWSFGDNEDDIGEYAWYGDSCGDLECGASHVGLKKPNPWGLYDMHGNVWEWCHALNCGEGKQRQLVIRGGSWYSQAESLQSHIRKVDNTYARSHGNQMFECVDGQYREFSLGFKYNSVGFRLLLEVNEPNNQDWIEGLLDWAHLNGVLHEDKFGDRRHTSGFYEEKEELLGTESLEFIDCKLIDLPKEIGNLVNLKELDVEQNCLEYITREIGKLTNLTELNLRQNKLSFLPDEIGCLTSLKKLDLQWNRLDTLPEEIGNLTNLIELNAECNNLNNIVGEIGKLTNLIELQLGYNKLTSLPGEMVGQLIGLQKLCLWENELRVLPHEIGNLISLTELELSDNLLTEIPKEIGELAKLERLNLENNKLTKLPKEIGKLSKLSYLELRNNQLIELPEEMGDLRELERFDLMNNQLIELPQTIGGLEKLYKLDLSNNKLAELPKEISEMSLLSDFELSNNQLAELPEEIGELEGLHTLNLRNNQLTELPQGIGTLKNLRILDLHNNQLMELPKEIGKLTSLSKLDISGNKFVSLPKEIKNLHNLSEVDLRNNLFLVLTDDDKEWMSSRNILVDDDKARVSSKYILVDDELYERSISKNVAAQNQISRDKNHIILFSDGYNAWYDEETKLIWEVKKMKNVLSEYTWSKKQNESFKKNSIKDIFSYVDYLNSNQYAGFSDWRVPTVNELGTLLDFNNSELYPIKRSLIENMSGGIPYWTSSEDYDYIFENDYIWVIDFYNGKKLEADKSDDYCLRCVRGTYSQ